MPSSSPRVASPACWAQHAHDVTCNAPAGDHRGSGDVLPVGRQLPGAAVRHLPPVGPLHDVRNAPPPSSTEAGPVLSLPRSTRAPPTHPPTPPRSYDNPGGGTRRVGLDLHTLTNALSVLAAHSAELTIRHPGPDGQLMLEIREAVGEATMCAYANVAALDMAAPGDLRRAEPPTRAPLSPVGSRLCPSRVPDPTQRAPARSLPDPAATTGRGRTRCSWRAARCCGRRWTTSVGRGGTCGSRSARARPCAAS